MYSKVAARAAPRVAKAAPRANPFFREAKKLSLGAALAPGPQHESAAFGVRRGDRPARPGQRRGRRRIRGWWRRRLGAVLPCCQDRRRRLDEARSGGRDGVGRLTG